MTLACGQPFEIDYGLDDLPDKETAINIAAPWRPYATVASWYCWQSLDLE